MSLRYCASPCSSRVQRSSSGSSSALCPPAANVSCVHLMNLHRQRQRCGQQQGERCCVAACTDAQLRWSAIKVPPDQHSTSSLT